MWACVHVNFIFEIKKKNFSILVEVLLPLHWEFLMQADFSNKINEVTKPKQDGKRMEACSI